MVEHSYNYIIFFLFFAVGSICFYTVKNVLKSLYFIGWCSFE